MAKRSKPSGDKAVAKTSKKMKEPPKALPVTLLSGFLGAGKTTLLEHILRTEHGLRIAVIVNDVGAINVDASLIKQAHGLKMTNEKVIALQNGCICCTLRGDLLQELVQLSQLQKFDYIIIESSGISEPEQVAETFDARLAEQIDMVSTAGGEGLDEEMSAVLKQLKKAGGMDKFARLDTTATVIDAFTMLNDFDTDDLLSSRRAGVTPEDERTVSDLMVDQIEFADVIVLNKIDMIDERMKPRIMNLIQTLNHRAKVVESSFGKVDVKKLVNTGLFSLEVAQTGYGWLQDLHEMTVREINGHKVVTPKPETEEYNIRSFVYSRYRPFHPRRLFSLLYDKFILQMEHPDDDDDDDDEGNEDDDDDDMADGDELVIVDAKDYASDSNSSDLKHTSEDSLHSDCSTVESAPSPTISAAKPSQAMSDKNTGEAEEDLVPPENAVILKNKRSHSILSRLFRSKGEFFLATRPHRAGDWSQAGAMLTLTGGRPWFCTLPQEDYITGDKQVDGLVQHDIAKGGEWGDRRQELVFIGENLNHMKLEALLDACLLDDDEFDKWQHVMRDEKLEHEERRDALEDLFDDGFPDWLGDDGMNDDHDHDHGHAGHDHTHAHGARSIRQHLEEVS